jgi:Domain of unknown function (DUF1707)/Domain of unknown function (DUF4190)
MAGGDYASMRASDEDRWRVQTHLNEAFAEGRLTQQEWDERASALGGARTYRDLDMLIADLPLPTSAVALPQPARLPYPQRRTNGLAIAALVCGLGQLAMGPPATVAAIVLGHKAQREIRQTGEPGDGLARAGLIMGYLGLSVAVVGVVLFLLVSIWITHHVPHGGGAQPARQMPS